jgi:catechol 2,3-dioxygenase-like lactoylglutathione lyase family enzyme
MEVQFVASIAPIVRDLDAAQAFYEGALGLSLEGAAAATTSTHPSRGHEAASQRRVRGAGRTAAADELKSTEELLVAVCYSPAFHEDSTV